MTTYGHCDINYGDGDLLKDYIEANEISIKKSMALNDTRIGRGISSMSLASYTKVSPLSIKVLIAAIKTDKFVLL